jgi:hypothetical protein
MKVMKRTPYVQGTHFVSSNGTNPQNMFTDIVSDATTQAGDLVVDLTPGAITAIGFSGLSGTDLTVVGVSSAVEVFRHEQSLSDETISDWFEYFFEPFDFLSDVFIDGIPPYQDLELTITVSGTDTSCGLCAFGRLYEFGQTQSGASAGIVDYSTKDVDEFGTVTLSPGPFSKRVEVAVFIPTGAMGRLQKVLAEMRATPTFYSFASETTYKEVMTVFGYYRDFSIVIPYPQHFLCAIDIEGLI